MYMNTQWELRAALVLIVILVIISLSGCSVPVIESAVLESDTPAPAEAERDQQHTPNFQGIADALGCVFAPDSCGK
jgi:PBP1b-binding outer membrane lipoprotein LpoB